MAELPLVTSGTGRVQEPSVKGGQSRASEGAVAGPGTISAPGAVRIRTRRRPATDSYSAD
jgi:hypothetical protein